MFCIMAANCKVRRMGYAAPLTIPILVRITIPVPRQEVCHMEIHQYPNNSARRQEVGWCLVRSWLQLTGIRITSYPLGTNNSARDMCLFKGERGNFSTDYLFEVII